MLGAWRSHPDYQLFLIEHVRGIFQSDPARVQFYAGALSKLYLLNLDLIKPAIESRYSSTGKPALHQPELFRSFVLMSELHETSLTRWVQLLQSDKLLCALIGVHPHEVPKVASHYDLINRLWLEDPEIDAIRRQTLRSFIRRPRKKLEKGQKLPPRHPGIIGKLVEQALDGRTLTCRPERLLQELFADLAVRPSAAAGLLGPTHQLSVSGDGTCIESGGSPYGIKPCTCKEQGIFNCDCKRRFSDPQARWGWDSHEEHWFYGYTGYFLSSYHPTLGIDLPLYLRVVEGPRHDGVSAIVALAEARTLYPNWVFTQFVGDSAHDNYPTYELLHAWKMGAVIPLNTKNKGHFQYPPPIAVDEHGIPICPAGHPMVYNGFMNDRCRCKWRCPLVVGKVDVCACQETCSPSPYGRTVYTKPDWDVRMFTPIPRGTQAWKDALATRTSSERLNKRILHDYGLAQACIRGKKRMTWWLTIHSLNIHLDARLKVSGFDFISQFLKPLPLAA